MFDIKIKGLSVLDKVEKEVAKEANMGNIWIIQYGVFVRAFIIKNLTTLLGDRAAKEFNVGMYMMGNVVTVDVTSSEKGNWMYEGTKPHPQYSSRPPACSMNHACCCSRMMEAVNLSGVRG